MPVVRAKIVLPAIYAAVFACLTGLYFAHYPIPGFFQRLSESALAAGFLVLSAGVGAALASTLRLPKGKNVLEDFLWSVGLGTPAWALALLFLGLLGGFQPLWIGALTAAAAMIGAAKTGGFFRASLAASRTISAPKNVPAVLLAFLIMATCVLALLCALAPPTYYDSLVYHLALPAKYLQEGRVGFIPFNHYSHFPQNMEMIFAWFLAFERDVSAQLFNVLLAVLTGAALWRAGHDACGLRGPRWDLALYASAPCVLLLSSETYVEVPLAFWTTLALWAFCRGLVTAEDGGQRMVDGAGARKWFVVAGLMGGFAVGIKYTGAITPALLFAAAVFWPRRRAWRERVGDAIVLGLPAFGLFLPWLVKNYFFTGGNPVFPFFPKWFPAVRVTLSQESSQAYFKVLDEYKGTSSLLVELFLFPFRLVTDAVSFGGGYDVTGDLGWALPLMLFPLALWAVLDCGGREAPPELKIQRFLAAYTAAHIVLWVALRPVLRFLFPLFPVVCLLAAVGWNRTAPWPRRLGTAVFVLFLASNAVLFYLVERVRDPFPAAFGLEDRVSYLRRKIDVYPALDFINRELPLDSRLLFVGDQRGYYCRRPYVAPMALLPPPLREWAHEAGDGESLRGKLLKLGFTHVLFHSREAERLKGYRVLDLTDAGRTAWAELTANRPRLHHTDTVTVYSLR